MKLLISIFLQQECGGWRNVSYIIKNSRKDEDYSTIRSILLNNLNLRIEKKVGKIIKSHHLLRIKELFRDFDLIVGNEIIMLLKNKEDRQIEIIVNEWIDDSRK